METTAAAAAMVPDQAARVGVPDKTKGTEINHRRGSVQELIVNQPNIKRQSVDWKLGEALDSLFQYVICLSRRIFVSLLSCTGRP